MNLTIKIGLTIIPKGYWVAFIVSILLLLIGDNYFIFGIIIINILVFLISVKFAILFHEIGHVIFAKIVKGIPRRIILGKGDKVCKCEFLGVKLVLNSNFNFGLAIVNFDDFKFIRAKLLFLYCGGFLTNFIISFIFFLPFIFSGDDSGTISFASMFALANFSLGIAALIPSYSTRHGIKIYSDGLSILRIPFLKKSTIAASMSVFKLFDADDHLESKEFEKAISIYEDFQSKNEKSENLNLTLSIAYMKIGNFQKSIELIETLLPSIEDATLIKFKPIIYCVLAWGYLLTDDLETADKYSELASEFIENDAMVRGTRASILIEKGQLEEGLILLVNDVDFNVPNNITLSAAMYVGYAYTKMGDIQTANKYTEFVDLNWGLLDLDDKIIYKRMKKSVILNMGSPGH